MNENKNVNNALLYAFFKAQTVEEKGAIRNYKSRYYKYHLDLKHGDYKWGKDAQDHAILLDKYALNPQKIQIWKLSDKDLKDLFIKFVGFVGYIDEEGYAVLDPEGTIHLGEALPEPVDEITDEYMGITEYQAEAIITFRDNANILNIWSRGFGKTWKSDWICEFTIKYEAEKFLYFSLTEVAYQVADYVYLWADRQGAIIDSETQKVTGKLSGRKSSYQKFGLINGSRFEIHDINSSSTLGFHGWNIVFDDVISELHKDLPHIQKRLENKWNSQYSKIRRKRFIMDNTRKFAGDFFDFMINLFEKRAQKFETLLKLYHQRAQSLKGKSARRYQKIKERMAQKFLLCIDLKSPYREFSYKGDVKGYRDFSKKAEENLIEYDTNDIIAPWYDPMEFEIMKLDDLEAFHAEMLGIPLKIRGGLVDPEDLTFVRRPHFSQNVLFGGCGVDCAQTEDEVNDYTAVVSCLLHQEQAKEGDPWYPRFTFYHAHVERMLARNHEILNENDPYDWIEHNTKIKRGIFETVQLHYEIHKIQYPNIPWICAWERNEAGISLMEQALRSYRMKEKVEIKKGIWVKLTFPAHLVRDPHQAVKVRKGQKTNIRLGITHKKTKTVRIYAELQYPIKNKEFEYPQAWFTYGLENSLFIEQLKEFPKGKHDDGPDAGGMIKDELYRRWTPKGFSKIPREAKAQEKKEQKAAESHREAGMPWLKDQRNVRSRTSSSRRKHKIIY